MARACPSLVAGFVLSTFSYAPADARVQPYQIIRLLSYKTNCIVQKVEDRSSGGVPLHFQADCENVTFYPDGVTITCADPDDDRSCKVETSERSLDQLKLLQKGAH